MSDIKAVSSRIFDRKTKMSMRGGPNTGDICKVASVSDVALSERSVVAYLFRCVLQSESENDQTVVFVVVVG